MPYTMDDIIWGVGGTPAAPLAGVWTLLASRSDLVTRGVYGWITDAILNISRNFRFPILEHSGPVIQFSPGLTIYSNNALILPSDTGLVTNLIPSFVRFFNPYTPVTPPNLGNNSSSTLKWKTVDALELMFNTPGIPTYFTRYGNAYMIAPVPDTIYNAYLRYQIEHTFNGSVAGKPQAVAADPFLLPNEWKQVVEYATAQIGATALRMLDYAQQYHTVLWGDPQQAISSEGRGNPGLIYRLISQMEGDSTSMMRSIRVAVCSPQ